ncbi:MAG TPA: esterase family protein [Candidatus Pullichristensenella excrementigallinarum]|uniref:Esterase family protein n=1 Tax=Candidatus Pullichristensenella excrementigallinarum TaxID=2840907 RepID=A0A9D1LAS6_9FIRM|nr:esterase family protein [Candidatus Pullichristensenella excrementigallinarum]
MAFFEVSLYSDALSMETEIAAYLPEAVWDKPGIPVDGTRVRVPTVYLLHGMFGNHRDWYLNSSVVRVAEELGIALILPQTHLGWYADMARGEKFFTYVARELPRLCRRFFPALSPEREQTFAAGLSMGGYGAFHLALRAPETFAGAASLSGGLDVKQMVETPNDHGDPQYWEDIFGRAEQVDHSHNDLFAAARELRDSPLRPRLYQWCGTEDFLYEQNTRMRDHLRALGYDCEYRESPGDHQWKYWDREIGPAIRWLFKREEEA